MSNEAVEQATKNLWDYINSLPDDRREKAIAYQEALEAEALKTEGGMQAVIQKQLVHQMMLLVECLDEVQEIAAGHVADHAIRGIMSHQPKQD